jgi:hypothetical protein
MATDSIPSGAPFTPGPWKTGDCDSSIIWAAGYRSVKWIESEPGPEAVEIATAPYPGWGRKAVLDALSLDDFERRDEWEAECRANARLIAAAPDHALICWAMCVGAGAWDPWGDGRGEFCMNGVRHATALDEFGAPVVTPALRAALCKARGDA